MPDRSERLSASEERQVFLLQLSDALRQLEDAEEIERTAINLLGAKLGLSRAYYGVIGEDGDTVAVRHVYTDGVDGNIGGSALSAFRPGLSAAWHAGRMTMVFDSETDPALGPVDRAKYASVSARAAVGVPIMTRGRLAAVLAVNQSTPRVWTDQETGLIREVAERAWIAIERAHAEAALRDSQALLAAAFDSVPVGVAVLDMAGQAVMSNGEYRRFLPSGRIPSRDPARAGHWRAWDRRGRLLDPEQYPGARAMRGERVVPGQEMLYTDDDGREIWTSVATVPTFDEHGRATGLVSVISDIDTPKRAQEALRHSEERLRQFGENSPDTLWVVDASTGKLEYLSAAYERMWGEPRERVMGDLDHWCGHVHPDDRAMVAQGLPTLLAGQRHTIEYRIVRPDGELRWIFDTGFPIRDDQGRVIRLAGVAQDVTARRVAEDRVSASERRFRTLSEGVPQLVWRAVDYGHWSWASPQWTAFTGQPEADSRGWGWLAMVHSDDHQAARRAWELARSTGVLAAEYRLHQAIDDRYRWFSIRATPVRDDDGTLVEWLGTSTDIDDLRRLQHHQQLLLAELQHRVRNSLAVIRSIARRTAETSATVEELGMHLDGRLASFARIQAAVTRDPLAGLDLRTIIADELLAHLAHEGEQAHLDGPTVKLRSKAGETLALAFHELATNAVKYGALATRGGTIRVGWRIERGDDGGDWLTIAWDETCPGAAFPPPTRRGFGIELLEETLSYELEAKTLLAFRPTGLLCTINAPFTDDIGTVA